MIMEVNGDKGYDLRNSSFFIKRLKLLQTLN